MLALLLSGLPVGAFAIDGSKPSEAGAVDGECYLYMVREGAEMLRRVRTLDSDPGDAVDRQHARILLEQPQRACDFSREQWLDKPPIPG